MALLAILPALVGATLVAAGAAKAARPHSVRGTLRRFGLHRIAALRGVPRALPAVEVVVGAGVLAGGGVLLQASLVAATALCAVFAALVARAVRRGESFDCGCFGSSGGARVSPALLLRNVLLLLASAGALADAGAGTPLAVRLGALTGEDALGLLLIVGTAALVGSWVAASRPRVADPATPPSGAPPADPAVTPRAPEAFRPTPDVEVVTAEGEVTRLRDLAAMQPVLIVFLRPGCRPCEELLDGVDSLDDALGSGVRLVLGIESDRAVFAGARPALADRAVHAVRSAREKLGVVSTPGAVLLGLNGSWVAGPVHGRSAVRELAGSARALLVASGSLAP